MTRTEATDEVLEALWTAREQGVESTVESLAERAHGPGANDWQGVVSRMVEEGLIARHGTRLELTSGGEAEAREIIRRHRLAELLFHEVLELGMAETERTACRLEHALSAAATEAVCTFLGHPPACPHGQAIPEGDCCRRKARWSQPLLRRLSELNPGETARIVFIAPGDGDELDQLADLGCFPGVSLTLRQHHPAMVVEVAHTTLVLDAELAHRIFVRPVS